MELMAQGRAADVFDLGEGRVLRRYREGGDVAIEARLMLHLEEHGYPVPHVFDADGADLVLERIDGGTLFEELVHEPGQYPRYGRLLGELIPSKRLHDDEVPSEGVQVNRSWQSARAIDGSLHLWIGRAKTPRQTDLAPALRFDVVTP